MKLNPRKLDDRLKQLGLTRENKKQLKKIILKRQKYKCKICGKDLKNADPHDIQLDHSHKPPYEIRGILCYKCNKYILTKMNEGHPEYFLNAYKYLKEDKSWIEIIIDKLRKNDFHRK